MAKVLGMGNALVDIIVRLETDGLLDRFFLPKGSMQLVDNDFSLQVEAGTGGLPKTLTSGGSAANTIHGLANLGIPSAYVGKVGNDEMGRFFREDLILNKIEPRLFASHNPTGRALALVSPDSERTFATYLGAAIDLAPEDITDGIFAGYEHFYMEGYLVQNPLLFEKAMKAAAKNNMVISLDLASYNVVEANRTFLTEMIQKYVTILFANEDEARAITGREPLDALHLLAEYTDIAVVKLGARGSVIKKDAEVVEIPSFKSNAIDTTGAGDLYAAGFLYGLISGLDLAACGATGSLISGRITEIIGPKIPHKEWPLLLEKIKKILH